MHIADSSTPANFSGGNVSGTRRILQGIPCSPRIDQNALLLRMLRMSGMPTGRIQSPMRIVLVDGRTSELDSLGV